MSNIISKSFVDPNAQIVYDFLETIYYILKIKEELTACRWATIGCEVTGIDFYREV